MSKQNQKTLRIFADFHNADEEGRVRLNCAGTIQDLTRHGAGLYAGQHLVLYSEELEAEGEVQFSDEERIWVARIDWDAIRDVGASDSGNGTESEVERARLTPP